MARNRKNNEELENSEIAITPKQLFQALDHLILTRKSSFIWGPPGIGKSDIVHQLAKKHNGVSFDVRLGQYDVTDVKGMPFLSRKDEKGKPKKETLEWAPSSEFPTAEEAAKHDIVILFLDELNQASPSVQAAAFQLILNRRVGKYELPDNCVVVAAGNRQSDKGVTANMPTPLKNRFVHFNLTVDVDDWKNWAMAKKVHPDVIGYISFRPENLMKFDPKSPDNAFPTPRSWEMVSDILKPGNLPDDFILNILIAGAVGTAAATEFAEQRKVAGILPDADEILAGKAKDLPPEYNGKDGGTRASETAIHFILVNSVCYRLFDVYKKCIDPLNAKEKADNKVIKTKMKPYFQALDNAIFYLYKNINGEMLVSAITMITQSYGMEINPTFLNQKVFSLIQNELGYANAQSSDYSNTLNAVVR